MQIECSSSSGHAENSDDHMEMNDRVNFGMLASVSKDHLLEEEDALYDQHFPTEKSPQNIEEGISSVTSAASSDDDPSPWRHDVGELSLPEVNGTIKIHDEDNASWYKKLFAFIGPGALVAVGYMDVSIYF